MLFQFRFENTSMLYLNWKELLKNLKQIWFKLRLNFLVGLPPDCSLQCGAYSFSSLFILDVAT